jgi:hypothetical protein
VCTALLVPLTTLWPTFLAVCTVLFATFFAVLTGPASIVPMEMATARIIDKNAFIVLINSFLTARMRLPDGGRVAAPKAFGAGPARIRTWDQGIMSPLL